MSTPPTPHQSAEGPLRLWLFALYLALYLGFMLLTAFALPVMASAPFGGVNLAVLYGFGLIVAAFVLALLYWWLRRDRREAAETRS
jgi:uncharacterized membrane protein (DUF485 family)